MHRNVTYFYGQYRLRKINGTNCTFEATGVRLSRHLGKTHEHSKFSCENLITKLQTCRTNE